MKNLEEIKGKIDSFKKSRKSVILGTINCQNKPLASYSPYVEKENSIFLYLSGLSEHKQNIIQNKNVSILFIEDESEAKMIAVRERLTYDGFGDLVKEIDLEKEIQALFIKEHGNAYESLPKMHDFSLIRIELQKGRYVFGFGNAYEIDGCDIKHINNK